MLEATHLVSAAVWLGALLGAGGSAAMLFPAMRALRPRLEDFAGYPGEHWKLAAGQVAQKLFVACDTVQLLCAGVCFLTLGLVLSRMKKEGGRARGGMLVRALALTVAMGLVCYQLFVLGPRMYANSREYWDSARAGEVERANAAQAAFAKDHPTSTNVLGGTATAVLMLIVSGAWVQGGGREHGR
jgi:hypothetical protein